MAQPPAIQATDVVRLYETPLQHLNPCGYSVFITNEIYNSSFYAAKQPRRNHRIVCEAQITSVSGVNCSYICTMYSYDRNVLTCNIPRNDSKRPQSILMLMKILKTNRFRHVGRFPLRVADNLTTSTLLIQGFPFTTGNIWFTSIHHNADINNDDISQGYNHTHKINNNYHAWSSVNIVNIKIDG